jgi:hypothetical protein
MHYNISVKCLTNIKGKEPETLFYIVTKELVRANKCRFTRVISDRDFTVCAERVYFKRRKRITPWKSHYTCSSLRTRSSLVYSIFLYGTLLHTKPCQFLKAVGTERHCREFFISLLQRDKPCDGELQPLMEDVQDNMDITFNFAPAGEHVPEAERNNRTIQERFRTQFHRLPYKAIPANMIKMLAMHVTHQLNLFPVKGSASKYYSPQQLMGGPPLDFHKHCQIPFGAYVQANDEPSPLNTPHARTLDAIYLRPMSKTNQDEGPQWSSPASGRLDCRSGL